MQCLGLIWLPCVQKTPLVPSVGGSGTTRQELLKPTPLLTFKGQPIARSCNQRSVVGGKDIAFQREANPMKGRSQTG